MENCNNCAWYCHSDGNCYYMSYTGWIDRKPEDKGCINWTFDGLKEWEREQMLLMTMENRAS